MSDKIRNRPPGPPTTETPPEPVAAKKSDKRGAAKKTTSDAPAKSDLFERRAAAGTQLQNLLQPLAGKGPAPKFHFNSQDIEQLAGLFAHILADNPQADRAKRARLLTAAILRRNRLKKMFAQMTEAEMEQMCDIIGDVVDSSPVFGQLVDDVTEGASK